MKIVISLGGISFSNIEKLKEFATVLDELALAQSCDLCVVTGGGERAREYIRIAREFGANEAVCDYLGIAFTRINARLLISALRNAYPEPFLDYREVALAKTSESGNRKIAVMGGVSPGYTTDAVAAILAEYVNADLLLNVSSVDGIYEADPHKYMGVKKYEKLSSKELITLTMKEELRAGSRIVIDPVAAKIIERSGIKTIVIDSSNPRHILDAVHGKHHGTEIHPPAF